MRRPNWSFGRFGTVLYGGEEAFKWLDICVGDHYSEVAFILLVRFLVLGPPAFTSSAL